MVERINNMKKSKIRIFKGYSDSALDREIRKWEDEGWEVAEHRLAFQDNVKCVTVLFQKDSSL